MNREQGIDIKDRGLRIRERGSKNLPFTLPGIAVLIIALVILVRSLALRNAYEIVLSVAALTLWAVLWLVGKWATRRLASLEPLWTISLPLVATSGEDWLVASPDVKIPRFFRLHFFVRGRFFPQGSLAACPVFAETSLSRKSNADNDNAASLKIAFPLGGLFRGETSCRLRDIFGFFSFPCGNNRERTLKVRSAPCETRALRINAQSGAEDRRNKSANDEERYYMREYAPGDRFRDINWKSSERIDSLITRISPDNQEKITRIEVYLRNYGPANGSSLADLWLLDRLKARLAWFLRKVKEEKSSYVFHVRSATGSWELNGEDEIEAFLEELSAIPFAAAQNEQSPLSQGEGELYVFSTSCDTALSAFLLSQQGRPLSLFLTQNAQRKNVSRENREPSDRLLLRDFPGGGIMPLPRWLRLRQGKQLKVNASRMMIDYAETRL